MLAGCSIWADLNEVAKIEIVNWDSLLDCDVQWVAEEGTKKGYRETR
jgi:hypothetical protein